MEALVDTKMPKMTIQVQRAMLVRQQMMEIFLTKKRFLQIKTTFTHHKGFIQVYKKVLIKFKR